MKKLFSLFLLFITFFLGLSVAFAQQSTLVDPLNKTNITIEQKSGDAQKVVENFKNQHNFNTWFVQNANSETPQGIFITIASNIKVIIEWLAVAFLIVAVLRLFLSDADDGSVKKWKNSIIWVTVGIIFMELSYTFWTVLNQPASAVDNKSFWESWSWALWTNLLSPIVQLLQYFAAFGFLAMMIYAFYVIVTGGGDEDKLKQGKRTFLFGILGFILIQMPLYLIKLVYVGVPSCENPGSFNYASAISCTDISSNELDKWAIVDYVAQFFKFFNGFLTLLCVILVIYAGFLLLTSQGNEDKVKKSKKIILYIAIGMILLVTSHAIFRFFILPN